MTARSTVFSPCRQYRYTLWRDWTDILSGDRGYAQFIGLNPSTADETNDDPTVRRCIQFAKDFGCSALCMTNLFAWRATDPKMMLAARDPVGPENDHWLKLIAGEAKVIIAAWGNDGRHLSRSKAVKEMLAPCGLQCLKVNVKTGEPSHPLYLPASLRPIPFPQL